MAIALGSQHTRLDVGEDDSRSQEVTCTVDASDNPGHLTVQTHVVCKHVSLHHTSPDGTDLRVQM